MEGPKIEKKNPEMPGMENEYKITRDMEIQADILKINLDKLKGVVEKAGGVQKFREMADKGYGTFEENGKTRRYSNSTDGESALHPMLDKLRDLEDNLGTKLVGGVGVLLAGGTLAGEAFGQINSTQETVAAVLFITGLVTMGGALISGVTNAFKARKEYIRIKEAEMKLKMTGSQSESALSSFQRDKDLQKKVQKQNPKEDPVIENPTIKNFL